MKRLIRIIKSIRRFWLWYLGLIPASEGYDCVRHQLLFFWEDILFNFLPCAPVCYLVRKTWDVAWIPYPSLDKPLKVFLVGIVMFASTYTFVVYHQPGHFLTEWKEFKSKRVYRSMCAKWIWDDWSGAREHAKELLERADELWITTGSQLSRYYQGISIYVLCKTGDGFECRQARRMLEIFDDSGIYKNEILPPDQIISVYKAVRGS